MNKKLEKILLQGKYKEAEELCKNVNETTIRDVLLEIAYDTESICVYSFLQYMIMSTEEKKWIKLAIDMMLNPLCFVEGAYSVALFHTRQLLQMEKSVDNLEKLLFFYNIPESLLEEDEARYIARQILKLDPDNEVALAI